ncbi:glycosyltransferase [Eupransor demetentiae]|uniref:Glycosyltransferase involved in cell wall bisynthesis (RfaB) n=1 Tax=Eupransor demetentiae TaxID=3109584 RepID=A0ABM9N4K9_9LACO|nr:Glycosyltransferase involved in cell wall bisynthesis (RfaB) [Lactobacillaceae bacterium LMG 33000]
MVKKVLIVSSTASMIQQFTMPTIEILQSQGYQVAVAANFKEPGTITTAAAEQLKEKLASLKVSVYGVDFPRGAGSIAGNWRAYQSLKKIMKDDWSFVYTQASLASVLSRILAHQRRIPVLYYAHGFQFYKGAGWKSWVLYYPIEKFLSRWTKVLVTINQEDEDLARQRFHAQSVERINGVGIDYQRFAAGISAAKRTKIRKDLGLVDNQRLLISVGELSARKNHRLVLEAMAKLPEKDWSYWIVGLGPLKAELQEYIVEHGLQERVRLLGYRSDVADLYHVADAAVFPSRFEGLMVAGMEAMAAGLPLIYAQVRGIQDYVEDGVTGYGFADNDLEQLQAAILTYLHDDRNLGVAAQKAAQQFDYPAIKQRLAEILKEMED